jgi:uncharacterized Zn-finger protein
MAKIHANMHAEEVQYKCKVCSRIFYERRLLYQHIKVHAGVKGYKCSQCDDTFSRTWQVKRHLNIVHRQLHSVTSRVLNDVSLDTVTAVTDVDQNRGQLAGNQLSNEGGTCSKVIPPVSLRIQLEPTDDSDVLSTGVRGVSSTLLYSATGTCDSLSVYGARSSSSKPIKQEPDLDVSDWFDCDVCQMIAPSLNMTKPDLGSTRDNLSRATLPPSLSNRTKLEIAQSSNVVGSKPSRLTKRPSALTAKQVYVCDVCKKSFSSKSHLMAHVTLLHPSDTD